MSAKRCLRAWYEAQRSPERVAVERPFDGHVEGRLHGTDRLRVQQDDELLELAMDLAAGFAGVPTTPLAGTIASSKVTTSKRRVRSTVCIGCHSDARRGLRDEDLGHAGSALVATRHEQVVCLAGRLHNLGITSQDEIGPRPARLDGRLPPRRTERRRAPGGDGLTGEQARQHVRRRVLLAEGGGDDVDDGQGPRRSVTPELVGDQAGVGQARVADGAAAVFLAHEERGPPQLGPTTPVGGVVADRVVTEFPQRVRRHLLGQETVGGLAKELLVLTQVQEHEAPSCSLTSFSFVFSGATA